jgi:hypothetical protein
MRSYQKATFVKTSIGFAVLAVGAVFGIMTAIELAR